MVSTGLMYLLELLLPGTVVRRSGQTAKLVWYPTEPADRNWVLTNGNHNFATLFLMPPPESITILKGILKPKLKTLLMKLRILIVRSVLR